MSNLPKDCIFQLSCLGIQCCLLKACKCEESFNLEKEVSTPDKPISKTPSELLQDELEPIL